MKIHKMFCIDEELIKKLEYGKASGLVNDLLTSHFKSLEPMTVEQRQLRIKELELNLEYTQKLRELKEIPINNDTNK